MLAAVPASGGKPREEPMMDRSSRRYVDHPAPSVGLMIILLLALCGVFAALPSIFETPARAASPVLLLATRALAVFVLALLGVFLWPLYSTYYTLSPAGIEVRYGPWTRRYAWSEFHTVFWQRGMFATRIGWPPVTPCVRLTDAVLLKRPGKWLGLYLTPNDSRAFLQRIAEFAPDLTAELVL
jgi:hypothetical protein